MGALTTEVMELSETQRLCRLAQAGDLEARNAALLGNIALVYSVARRHIGRGLEYEDLVHEGCIGLMRAIERYDESRGFAFSTYGHWWIRQRILRAIDDTGLAIRLPAYKAVQQRRVLRTAHDLEAQEGHEPTREEIAEGAEMTTEAVADIFALPTVTASLDREIRSERGQGDLCLGDFVLDPQPGPDERGGEAADRDALHVLLRRILAGRELRVIVLRFGLGDYEEHTLEQIARDWKISRERVRQIEAGALTKLRLLLQMDDDGSVRLRRALARMVAA